MGAEFYSLMDDATLHGTYFVSQKTTSGDPNRVYLSNVNNVAETIGTLDTALSQAVVIEAHPRCRWRPGRCERFRSWRGQRPHQRRSDHVLFR